MRTTTCIFLDTLDYHLRWGNYSADYGVTQQRSGKAALMLNRYNCNVKALPLTSSE